MEEVHEEPLFVRRVAGLDIAKAEVEVTIRVPSDTSPGRRQQETRTFGTTRRQLLDLADCLRSWGVAKVGMEATSDYWKPVFFLLESRGFDCDLYNAAQVRALPGRPKTDRADSIWLAKITERGMIASSFVPPEPIRRLRTHTRYRRHLTQARTAEKQRVEKLPGDGHLKLSSVIPGHPRRLGPGHAGRARRRAARPARARGHGPREDARQDPPPGGSAGVLVLHR
jgi:transposase